MAEDLGIPCVLIRCTQGYNRLYVWSEEDWDRDEAHWLETGRVLITRAPNDTCRALRDLMEQQEKENAN